MRRDPRTGGRRLLATMALVATAAMNAPGQVLDLDDAPAFPATQVSALDELAARVLVDLPEVDLSSDVGIVRSASTTLRRVIAELAGRGRGAGEGDAAAALAAIRLSASLDGIDRRLARLSTPGAFTGNPPLRLEEASRRKALDRLSSFSRSALEALRRSPTDTLDRFDDAIRTVLAPIVDVLEIIERRPLHDHWPQVSEVADRGVAPAPPVLPTLPARPGMTEVDTRLRPGGEAADRDLHRRFRDAADRAASLDSTRPGADAVLATLDAAATDDVDTLRRRIEMLELGVAIAADLESIARGPARRDADPDALAAVLEATLAAGPEPAAIVLLERQRTMVGLVAAGADVDLDSIERDLRSAARAVQVRHRRIVRSTVSTLLEIGTDPSALGSPDIVGALQALQGSIDDLQRLRTADELAARMTAIRPGAVREFRDRVRGWCRMLGDDATQAEGAAAIDAINEDLDRFLPLPAERWLASGGPLVTARTGGRGKDLLDRMTETRRQWADEVFHGELAGPARGSLGRLANLGELLVALDSVLADDDLKVADGLAACDRWGGWFVVPDRLAWTARQLAPSIRIAVAAAADGDRERLTRDLERLGAAAPPAALVAWLAAEVGPSLADVDDGSIGAVAATALPPGTDAWGLAHRATLARICRAFAEIHAARERGDEELVRAMTAWVVASCDDVLDRASSDDRRRDSIGGRR